MALDIETAAMVEDLIGRAELAAVEVLNAGAARIVEASQQRVPRDDDPDKDTGKTLADSVEVDEAVPGKLEATVVYNSPYATAQEIGEIDYQSRKAGRPVHWRARHYTTPGTGAHYLSDAGKAVQAQLPTELETQGQLHFGGGV